MERIHRPNRSNKRPISPPLRNYKPRKIHFEDSVDNSKTGASNVETVPQPKQDLKLIQRSTGSFQQKVLSNRFHEIQQGLLTVTPIDLELFGLKLGELDQESEAQDVTIPHIQIEQQLEFWKNANNLIKINSLLVTIVMQEPPYEYFDWRGLGPLIGIYKRSGKTHGQAVWITLPEAQVVLRIFVHVLNAKKAYYQTKKQKRDELVEQDFDLTFNLQAFTYNPVNFTNFGVSKDYVYGENAPEEELTTEFVMEALKRQQATTFVGGDAIYPVGSVDILTLQLQDRELFAIYKKIGSDAGQRIWFSIHEATHLCYVLENLIKRGVEHIKKP